MYEIDITSVKFENMKYFILYNFMCSIKLITNFSFLSILLQNGTLLRHAGDRYLSVDEYCFDVYSFKEKKTSYFLVNPFVCGLKNTPWYIEFKGYGKLVADFIIEPGQTKRIQTTRRKYILFPVYICGESFIWLPSKCIMVT